MTFHSLPPYAQFVRAEELYAFIGSTGSRHGTRRVAEAARFFVEARAAGRRSRPAGPCRPAETAADCQCHRRCRDRATRRGQRSGGRSVHRHSPRQKPFLCPMFASRVLASPAAVPLSLTHALLMEPEICFRLRRDFPPRKAAYRMEEIAEAVDACPSIEIVDTRFDNKARTDPPDARRQAGRTHRSLRGSQHHGRVYCRGGPQGLAQIDFAATRAVMRSDRA